MANLYIKRQDKRFKNGQSGLEYVALITVVAAVILSIVWLSNGRSIFQQKLESAFTAVGDKIVYEIEKVK